MGSTDIDWIVEKASELLQDKVEDGPLKEDDIDLAFDVFAEPRLNKISDSFSDEEDFTKAANEVRVKLHEVANQLNKENWPDKKK